MTTRSTSRSRALVAVFLAIALPAMAMRPYTPPERSLLEPGCHQPAGGRQEGSPEPAPSHAGTECATCCCIPSAVLASAPVDASVLFLSVGTDAAPADRIRERPRQPLPRLLPFAIAPPGIA